MEHINQSPRRYWSRIFTVSVISLRHQMSWTVFISSPVFFLLFCVFSFFFLLKSSLAFLLCPFHLSLCIFLSLFLFSPFFISHVSLILPKFLPELQKRRKSTTFSSCRIAILYRVEAIMFVKIPNRVQSFM